MNIRDRFGNSGRKTGMATFAFYLKKASKTAETESESARKVVAKMLAEIEAHGEEAVKRYALELDRWSGPIVVTEEDVARCLVLLR